jgi:hypothetical protein
MPIGGETLLNVQYVRVYILLSRTGVMALMYTHIYTERFEEYNYHSVA